MRKIFVLSAVLLSVLSGFVLSSCSNDENLEVLEKSQQSLLNPNAKDFKALLVDNLKKGETRNGGQVILSVEQMKLLESSSVKVLKDFGFTDEELKEYSDKNDPRLILMGAIFLGIAESNNVQTMADDACYDANKALDCMYSTLKDAIGVTLVEEIWNSVKAYKCLTKKILKEAIEQGLKKVPGISIVTIIYDYSSCMGWI